MEQFNNEKLNLEILAEEAGEVVRIKSKCIRFGMEDYHPVNAAVNKVALAEEIGHFLAMVDILIHHDSISGEVVNQARLEKKKSLNKWYFYKGES